MGAAAPISLQYQHLGAVLPPPACAAANVHSSCPLSLSPTMLLLLCRYIDSKCSWCSLICGSRGKFESRERGAGERRHRGKGRQERRESGRPWGGEASKPRFWRLAGGPVTSVQGASKGNV